MFSPFLWHVIGLSGLCSVAASTQATTFVESVMTTEASKIQQTQLIPKPSCP
jgi:hypothetical protein